MCENETASATFTGLPRHNYHAYCQKLGSLATLTQAFPRTTSVPCHRLIDDAAQARNQAV